MPALQPSDPLPSDPHPALPAGHASQPAPTQQVETHRTDRTGGGAAASPDPEPVDTPSLTGGSVQPGETPPSSSQTSGVAHQEAPPASGISWGFVVAIVLIVVLIGGGAVAAAISYL